MNLRPAATADLEAIARVQLASPEASQWSPAEYLNYRCTVAEGENGVAGFLVFRAVAPDENEILNLAVEPAARRKGIARALLAGVLAASGGPGVAWFLEVRASNAAAIRLYEGAGFRAAGYRSGYYHGTGRGSPEDAIVMRL